MDERDEFLIQEYVDDELDNAQREQVEAVLAQSAEARAFLAELQTLNETFALLTDLPLATDFSAQIEQQVVQHSLRAQISSRWLQMLLLGQLLVVVVLLGLFWSQMSGWLANGRITLNLLLSNIQLPTFTFGAGIAEWGTAVFQQTDQLLPVLNLAPSQWAFLVLTVLIIWLAGNRLLFTSANSNGGSHG